MKERTTEKKYFTYIIRCEDNSLYTGITTDVQRRFGEHREGKIKGAKYTKAHKPLRVEAAWCSESRISASKLEYAIKALEKSEKEKLIAEKKDVLSVGEYVYARVFDV